MSTNLRSSLGYFFPAWAYVGVGQSKNLQVAKKEDLGGKGTQKIIVSMSHAGSVKELAVKKLGDNVEIVSAAGAGE